MKDNFLENIPEDFVNGVIYILDGYEQYSGVTALNYDIPMSTYHENVINYYFLLEAFFFKNGYSFDALQLTEDMSANVSSIEQFTKSVRTSFEKELIKISINETKSKYSKLFDNEFSYEFTKGDLSRIQQLINELRDNIITSELFEDDHKQRLLKRLERMQSELHKKMSDLDRFWGLIGDAGIAIGKFGESSKPFVDRIREIADIVWRTQSKAEELPTGTNIPLLSNNHDK